MAFDRAGWQPLGGQSKKGTAPAMWSYTSTDAKTAIDAAGYFNDVSQDVSVGDIIYSWASTGGTATASWHVVVSNASGVVDVGDAVTIAVTDSD
jgi:hypothetical protein|tara:strand:- start:3314 stop:3595 length:282 start_codon:yes stop_codon:yes gene_type:complete